jgi:hypothetical protein
LVLFFVLLPVALGIAFWLLTFINGPRQHKEAPDLSKAVQYLLILASIIFYAALILGD